MLRSLVLLALSVQPVLAEECFDASELPQVPGRVELTYRVTATCEVADVKIVASDPPGVFDDAAVRLVRSRLAHDVSVSESSSRVLTQEDAEAELARYRATNPDKYNSRAIVVQLADNASHTLTCFFDKDGRRTSMELSGDTKTQQITDPLQLPTQRKTVMFEGKAD
jgi:hypothetical protein